VLNKTQTRSLKALAAAGLSLAFLSPAFAGKTLDAIKQRGQVVCGVNTGLAGFSAADSSGNWTGLDVDVCKAVAAATLQTAARRLLARRQILTQVHRQAALVIQRRFKERFAALRARGGNDAPDSDSMMDHEDRADQ